MELSADHVVLIAGPESTHLVAVLVILVALLAGFASAAMAWRGRVEGWSLLGVFLLIALGAVAVLAHMPTRVAFNRAGAEVSYGPLGDRRPWSDFATVDVERLWGGLRLRFTPRQSGMTLPPWSQWPGLFVPDAVASPRDLTMRIEAWRLSATK
ncbi:hypothetical protein GJW-30_1_02392 [Variibacter gotjawalensis]|uniref:PH domain-containing protein n=1 Tax=Variibacter gotjawalensis TaxID=1333996 RepID=A0A0S3PV62_9BRAD|nr:hypothetical protein [Variibacter gotjawalensis]NIK50185.1 hypothetical protein [Variibacter gotjawalensis]RZS46182.1 hypothetical protein EV661_4513 [Variibacter gotjawalensis]BAT59857.1 hypothetical protein GJW-30_1_02392 [Variibacter gotjawalensis]